MSKLKDQIEQKKTELDFKRRQLKHNWRSGKRRFSKSITFDISLLGGLALGYLIMPRRLGRLLLKSWSIYSTVKQFSNLFVGKKTELDLEHRGHGEHAVHKKLRRVK